jgi:acyl carrier protein
MGKQELEKFLVDFVVEQTGYPPEMVELDADLEADLGIDSIKKAQLFGELAEYFDVQATADLSLDDFPTLRHVVNFLDGVPQKAAAPEKNAVFATPAAPTPTPASTAVAPVVSAQPPKPAAPLYATNGAATAASRPAAPPTIQAAGQPASTAPAAVAQPPQTSAGAPSAGALQGKALEEFLVNFVVEQTGYPPEMVELDADLEADLGIDSIKKAQLFGELAEYFEVQVSEDLSLDDFPTLRHVVNFLDGVPQRGNRAVAAPSAATPATAPPSAPAATTAPPAPAATPRVETQPPVVARSAGPATPPASPQPPAHATPATGSGSNGAAHSAAEVGDLEKFLVNFVVEQTGYPPEMVELDADLEADLGIDSIKKAQLFGELAEYFEVQVSEDLSLDDFPTLRHVMNFLKGVPRKMPV